MNSLLHRKCQIHTVLTVFLSARLSVLSLMLSWNILCFTTFPYSHPKATDLNIQLTCLEISPHDYIRKKSMPNGPKCSYKACRIYVYIVKWEQAAQPPILTSLISMIYMNQSIHCPCWSHSCCSCWVIELLAQIGVL